MPVFPYKINGYELGYDIDIWSNLSNSEALEEVRNANTEFANSLYVQSLERPLSKRQWYWVHRLAQEARGVKIR